MATVPVSYRAEYRTPIEFVGETGVARADNALNVEHPIELQLLRDGAVAEKKKVSNQLVYAAQVDAFADAIEGKAPFLIPGEEGWRNQEILDAALRSIKSGKAEAVPRMVSP
jgi:predicted dehydrogenase